MSNHYTIYRIEDNNRMKMYNGHIRDCLMWIKDVLKVRKNQGFIISRKNRQFNLLFGNIDISFIIERQAISHSYALNNS